MLRNMALNISSISFFLLDKKDLLRYPSNYLGKNKNTFWKKCNVQSFYDSYIYVFSFETENQEAI